MRLNVACSSGGWLHIGDPQDSGLPPPGRLCGKLEELSAAQRRLHFPTPPALHVHGQLVFALRYRLVDYCHQVALVQSNASVPLAASPGLTCTFSVTLPHGYHVNMRLLAGEPVPGTPVDVVDINTPSGGSSSENADEKEGEVREAPVEDNVEIVSTDVDLISHAATASGTAAAAGPATSTATTTSYYRSSAQRGPTAASSSTRPKRPRARRDGPGQPPTSPTRPPTAPPQRPTPSSARVAEFLRDAMLREHRPPGPLASTAAAPSAAPTSTFSRLALHEENFAATSSSSSSSSEESSEEDEEAANATRAVRGRMRRNYNDVILEEDALASPSPSSPAKVFRFLSARNMLQLTVRMGGLAVPLRLDYDARPVRRVVQGCAFGWVAVGQFCVTAVEDFRLGWADAETECRRRGGHLASIPDQEAQRAIDDLLTNSPGYSDHNSYWVGASDVTNEGDFRWTDSLPFSYTNWFPGWTQHGGYNRQPNDDGFSAQDCVELRRAFLLPPSPAAAALTKALPLDSSFRWNDRDCSTRNHFLCERPRDAQYPGGDHWSTGDCTRTVTLTRESLRAVLTSPGFPRAYPNDAQCDTDIVAPPGHRLVLDFEEFVLEKEPYCSYDYLTIREDIFEEAHKNVTNTSLHAGLGPPGHPNLTAATPTAAGHPELSHLGMEGHVLVGRGHHRYCGDWSEKLKLLRYTSRGPRLRLRFHSDYSHHFGGFKARVSAETDRPLSVPTAMECPDPRQYSFNSSCFLVVSFPQVTWQTARQVCEGLKTEMAEVFSSAEQDFVVDRIRHSHDYSTSNTYWLGGLLRLEGRWEWLSGQPMAFTGWIPPPSSLPDPVSEEPQDSVDSSLPSSCLALQWRSHNNKQLPSALPSGMYWAPRKCTAVGGYVCRTAQVPVLDLSKHLNVTLTEPGTLSSPGYPSGYPANLDYQVRLVGPPQSRVVVRFARVDLEAQAQCLYDFIELSDARAGARQGRRKIICGQHHSAAAMERFDFVSSSNEAVLRFRSDYSVAGAGFLGSWTAVDVSGCPQQTLSAREGELTSPFYPHKLLPDLQCTAIVRAPAGRRVWLEFTDVDMGGESTMWVDLGAGRKVVRDSYADNNGSTWILCEAPDASTAPFVITSYLNTLQLWQRGQESGVTLNATIQPIRDEDYRVKLVRMSNASWSVESCSPNPCQNDGKCLVRDRRRVCECKGHFTGLLCGLTECDLEPCVWGKCILTPGSFRCACAPHYKGALCNVRAKPCNDNPCEGRGECHEKGDTFHCRCHAWWEGPKCERRMSVPFKPLSERMLQEPFWLGLITVTAVLGVIGLFWCAKRHFPEKLEKLLAEEADRNRSGGIYPSRGSSLRDQLHAGPGASHSLAASTASASGTSGGRGDVGGGPGGSGGGGGGGSRDGTGPQPPRSLLGRLGIRKPSILSLTATAASPAETGATARTFSLDDLLRPPPGRTPSPRKKRNNSTPTRQRSAADAAEKKQILQQLVSGTSLDGEPLLLDSLGDSNVNNNNKAMSRTPSVKGSRAPRRAALAHEVAVGALLELPSWLPAAAALAQQQVGIKCGA
ncbi:hypothetical protein ONE63_006210 [Megalurothrips usitatus]|uniref:Uncharacterized protein n=1 Tax=Megalurothrips usitatus TaxID=439358 RepID=A0AAV7XWP4_9NEOP|nr:hypothetical protein ONE63_006210 [Megalurothrips usitatus]